MLTRSRGASLPAEVGVHVREAVVLSQGEQNAGGTAAVPLAAEAAVTNASAWGARPLLQGQGSQISKTKSCNRSESLFCSMRKQVSGLLLVWSNPA